MIPLNIGANARSSHWPAAEVEFYGQTLADALDTSRYSHPKPSGCMSSTTMDIPRNVNGDMRLLAICELLSAVASKPRKVSKHLHGAHSNTNANGRSASALPLVLAPPLLWLLDG